MPGIGVHPPGMQILDERDVAEVVEGPITVTKSALDLGRDNVSGVRLTIESSASDPVAVEVVEEFPGHVSMSDIQVHPSYGPHRWTISEQAHRMVFEDEIPAGGMSKTIYGVRVTHDEALDPFLGRPTLIVDLPNVGPGDDAEDVVEPAASAPESAESSSDPAPSADEEPSSTESASTSADGAVGDDEPATVDPGDDPFVYGEDRCQSAGRRDSAGSSSALTTEANEPRSANTGRTLVERIARIELSDAQRQAIRTALDLSRAQSQPIQLADLQSSVAQLSAFADEMEAAVDAVGRPAETIEALEASVEQLTEAVEEVSATDRATEAVRDDLRERVDGLERDLQELRADQSASVDALDDRLAELEAVFDAHEFAAIREVIEAERAWRERSTSPRSGRPPIASRSPTT